MLARKLQASQFSHTHKILTLNKRCRLQNSFFLGAGTHIGSTVAAQLRENGYRVALVSRNPSLTPDDEDNDTYFAVKVDVQSRESIEEAFDTVVHKLGPVNIVIYNGISLFVELELQGSLPISCFCHSAPNTRRHFYDSS